MKSEKLKRFRVTQTLRFPSNIMKGFFYAGLVLLPLGLIVAALSFFVPALEGVRGIAVIAAALSVIWLFAAKFISETNFGLANVSFTEQGIIFRTGGADSVEYRLNWDDAVCCGRIKTRWSWWCYEMCIRDRNIPASGAYVRPRISHLSGCAPPDNSRCVR